MISKWWCSFLFFTFFEFSLGQYSVPEVKLQAIKPRGLRGYIEDTPGIQFFAFHGKKNSRLNTVEPGDLKYEVKSAANNIWSFYDRDIQLKVGDVIHYWVFVQYNRLGYRRDEMKWTVQELVDYEEEITCKTSLTIVKGQQNICENVIIFEDTFTRLNRDKWKVHNYIPKNGPNFEFNSYENKKDIINFDGSRLSIKPFARDSVRGVLDLTTGCTSEDPNECRHENQGAFLLPAAESGKLTSKFTFKYGKIEIRAKLPAGDWLYPEVTLVPTDKRETRIWIAYARGNKDLRGNDGQDIGGRMLFGGPVLYSTEPERSKYLKTRYFDAPLSDGFHTYTLIWEPNAMTMKVDNIEYGKLYTSIFSNQLDSEFYISLAVGVGGINDFPNDFKSGSNIKPWKDRTRKQIQDFFNAKNKWLPTWQENSLQVEYVKVFSL